MSDEMNVHFESLELEGLEGETPEQTGARIAEITIRKAKERFGNLSPEVADAMREHMAAFAATAIRATAKRAEESKRILDGMTNREIGIAAILHNDFRPGSKQWIVVCEAASRLIGEPDAEETEADALIGRLKGTALEPD